jgi:hypothetical protein
MFSAGVTKSNVFAAQNWHDKYPRLLSISHKKLPHQRGVLFDVRYGNQIIILPAQRLPNAMLERHG